MKTKSLVSGTAALALSALLFTACNNEDNPVPVISSEYVTIAPTVTGEVITKANASYGQSGDKLYLYYNTAGNKANNQSADFRFNGGIWDLGTTKMKWDALNTAAGENATLPFFATSPLQAPMAATNVETAQNVKENFINSDLLVAYKAVTKIADATTYSAIDLNLKHVLAKLTIEVNATALDNPIINSVTLKGAITAYKVAYYASEDSPATTTTDGNTTTEVTPLANGSIYTAILPAQLIQAGTGITVEIAADGQTFTYKPSKPISLIQGKNTTLKLRLAGNGVILGDVTVSDWGDGETASGNVSAD